MKVARQFTGGNRFGICSTVPSGTAEIRFPRFLRFSRPSGTELANAADPPLKWRATFTTSPRDASSWLPRTAAARRARRSAQNFLDAWRRCPPRPLGNFRHSSAATSYRFFRRRGATAFGTRFFAFAVLGFKCPSSISGSPGRSPQPSVPVVGPEGFRLGWARVGLSPKGLMSSLIGFPMWKWDADDMAKCC